MSRKTGSRSPSVTPQERLTVRPNEILTHTPMLQAVEQMRNGDEAEVGPRPARWFFDGPPKMKPVPPDAPNLVGQKWGRVTVIGLLDKRGFSGSNDGASWVIRCSCGMYETRKAKAIRNKTNPDEGCTRCSYAATMEHRNKRRDWFDKYGEQPDEDRFRIIPRRRA